MEEAERLEGEKPISCGEINLDQICGTSHPKLHDELLQASGGVLIESMLAKFWWGTKEGNHKLHWMSWERMSQSKNKGVLGFRGFIDFNKALIGKQGLRLITGGISLMEKVFKARYFPRGSFMEAGTGFQPSYAWRSLISARDVIEKGSSWVIGNGQQVHIWNDIWIPIHLTSRSGALLQTWKRMQRCVT